MNRLKELRKEKGVRQVDVAKEMNVSQNTLSYWEQGKFRPTQDKLIELSKYYDVTIDYLIGNSDNARKLSHPDNVFKIEKVSIPLIGTIAAGGPILASEEFQAYVVAGSGVQADFCLKVKGDSMINARIYDGDIVFIKEQSDVNNGEIAAVLIGDEATLKRVYKDENQVSLVAENANYQPLVYRGEEINELRILGKAVAFQSDIR